MISLSKAGREALEEASLLGVPKSKKCVKVLTAESDVDSDYDDNGAAKHGASAAPLSS